MRISLGDYVDRQGVTLTIRLAASGRYSGNVHYGDMLIGGVGGTNKGTVSSLPEKGVKTATSLVSINGRYYVQFDNDAKVEVTPLPM